MTLQEKLAILADSAKYDASCSSSGSTRKNTGGLGNAAKYGICHSFSKDGRCISLLKILFSNCCCYNCKYCINRSSNQIQRATFTPEEICYITMNFYRRNYIEGLFLSSGIIKNPDYTMEKISNTKVIDPTFVSIESLKNATSIASMLLTTKYLIINEFNEKKKNLEL